MGLEVLGRATAVAPQTLLWRRELLGAAGFTPGLSAKLAADPRQDLHALIGLVEAGCPPALAARILAPLDDPLAETA